MNTLDNLILNAIHEMLCNYYYLTEAALYYSRILFQSFFKFKIEFFLILRNRVVIYHTVFYYYNVM